MTDQEFAIEMEYEIRKRGSLGVFRIFGQSMEAFMGTVLTGENAGAPSAYDFALGGQGLHPSIPIGQSGIPIHPGQTVMVDICGNFNGYNVDQTRIFSLGKTTPEAYYAHQVSIEIHNTLAEMGKPGAICEDLYEKALEIAKKHHLEDCFMGRTQQASFVGHGIGLVINELPVLCRKNKETLQAGMAIALEPKFVIDKIGAVGNESTYIVHENGMEKVTTAPEEIISF
jgi:Xaa-Pro aminopeptidase